MAQVSYGTITITDTTDIERIYVEYCRSTSNQLSDGTVPGITVAWSENTPPWVNGQYIWQHSVVKKSGSTDLIYGTPVCLTGAAGATGAAGRGLTATVTKYCNYGTGEPAANYSGWVDAPPSYDSSKPNYWVKITNTYSAAPTSENIIYKDEALTKAVTDAAIANSIAQHANEDAQGAMSQAASAVKEVKRIWFAKATSGLPAPPSKTGVTTGSASTYNSWSIVKPAENSSYPYYFYCDQTCTNGGVYSHSEILLEADPYTVNALNVRTKNFFHGKDSTYDGWFASGRSTNEGLNESDATTYHYNARVGATNVTLGYNKTPVIDLDGKSGAINIYRLPTINSSTGLVTAAGKLGAKLNASALTFYNTSGTATSTFGDSIALASNGASITIGSTGTGKYNTYIDAQGLYLRTGTTSYATLNSNGLVLSKGGITVNTVGSNNGVYISSENLGSKVASLVNDDNKTNWRAVIGSKFGVDSEGNLYANEAHISGAITATSLTIGSNATINDTSGLISNSAVEVGGRNLVWDTEWKNISTRWTDWGTPTTREIVTLNGKQWLHLVTTANSYQGYSQNWTKREDPTSEIQAGDTVVFSYTAYAETAGQVCTVGCHWNNSSGSIVNQNWFASSLTTTPKRYTSQPFTVPANAVKFNVMVGQGVAQAQNLYISEVKIEKGNKTTDWTPAPEDVDNTISSSVDAVGEDLSDFQKDFDQRLLDYDDALYNEETGLDKRLQDLGNNLKEAKEQFAILANSINGYMAFGDTSDPNQVALTLGAKSSPYKVRLTNSELQFLDGNTTPMAYMNNQSMFVQNSLSFGNFMFYQRDNGHFTLKYTGGNN